MKKILHDDYGNRAEIEEVVTLPYKDSPKKEKGYRLSLYAEYDNDFLYFRVSFARCFASDTETVKPYTLKQCYCVMFAYYMHFLFFKVVTLPR